MTVSAEPDRLVLTPLVIPRSVRAAIARQIPAGFTGRVELDCQAGFVVRFKPLVGLRSPDAFVPIAG